LKQTLRSQQARDVSSGETVIFEPVCVHKGIKRDESKISSGKFLMIFDLIKRRTISFRLFSTAR